MGARFFLMEDRTRKEHTAPGLATSIGVGYFEFRETKSLLERREFRPLQYIFGFAAPRKYNNGSSPLEVGVGWAPLGVVQSI